MLIENIKTKERYTVAWWAGNVMFEWYGFKRVEINGKPLNNIWEGYVMNNMTSEDEFGDIDLTEILSVSKTKLIIGDKLNSVQPPIGFRCVSE